MNEIATFGGGCFWGVEARFREYKGVIATRAGYTGGSKENPTYEDVCKNTTGHAESVEIQYDSQQISYEDLLDIFFEIHDPTQVNRQGPDVGSQYRTVIFYHSEKQKTLAEKKIQKGRYFSQSGWEEIQEYHCRVVENLQAAVAAFAGGEKPLVEKVKIRVEELDREERKLKQNHIRRLHQGLKESIDTSAIHLDLLSNLQRINSEIEKGLTAYHEDRDRDS